MRIITPPMNEANARSLNAGDEVLISGIIYTARDAAHQRFNEIIVAGKELPVNLSGQILYYVGPAPAPPGKPIGSAGPTTSARMDAYAPLLIEKGGLRGMIGKGGRGSAVIDAMKKCGCVYFAAIGGAGALLAKSVVACEPVCYPDLGPEAVYKLTVEKMPVIAAIDCRGHDLYADGPARYARRA